MLHQFDTSRSVHPIYQTNFLCRLVVALFIATLVQPLVALADTDQQPRIFMYVTDGSRDLDLMLTEEVGVMRQMLEDAGYVVDIATSAGQKMESDNASLEPTIGLENVNVDDYAGVILPCMAPAPGESDFPDSVKKIMKQAVDSGKPVAASRGSVYQLAAVGGVENRQFAAFANAGDTAKYPEFANGTFLGTGVVRDGNISTAGICPLAAQSLNEPDGTVELTQEFLASLAETG